MSFGRRRAAGFCGVERRAHVRRTTDASALVVLPTLERMTARVVDFTSYGARLTVPTAFAMPATFSFRARGRTYRAEVIWSGRGDVGVRFI